MCASTGWLPGPFYLPEIKVHRVNEGLDGSGSSDQRPGVVAGQLGNDGPPGEREVLPRTSEVGLVCRHLPGVEHGRVAEVRVVPAAQQPESPLALVHHGASDVNRTVDTAPEGSRGGGRRLGALVWWHGCSSADHALPRLLARVIGSGGTVGTRGHLLPGPPLRRPGSRGGAGAGPRPDPTPTQQQQPARTSACLEL